MCRSRRRRLCIVSTQYLGRTATIPLDSHPVLDCARSQHARSQHITLSCRRVLIEYVLRRANGYFIYSTVEGVPCNTHHDLYINDAVNHDQHDIGELSKSPPGSEEFL